MAILTPTTISRAGVNLTSAAVAAASGGDQWQNTGQEFLLVWNGDASSKTVTLVFGTGATVDGQTPASRTVVVPAAAYTLIGPFDTDHYNDVNDYMNVTYSAVTSVKVLVLTLGS